MFVDCVDDVGGFDVDKERVDCVPVDAHGDVGTTRVPDVFDVGYDVAQEGLLHTCLDDTSSGFRDLVGQFAGDDRRGDGGGGIDNFLDTRDTLSDGHTGDTSKMESLQCHLRTRLTNRLRTDSTHSVAWLDS